MDVDISALPPLAVVDPADEVPLVKVGLAYKAACTALLGATGTTGANGTNGTNGTNGADGATGAVAAIGLHDTTHTPGGLWQFQSSLADASGNGYTLSVDTGSVSYSQMVPGLVGIRLNSLRLTPGTGKSALALLGDMTISCLLLLTANPNGNPILSYTTGQDDTLEIYNYLYHLELSAARCPKLFHEHAVGLDDIHALTQQALPPKRQLIHYTGTRIGNVYQHYAQGRALGDPSSALNTPTGGSSSQLWIGGSGGVTPTLCADMLMASLKISPVGLTAAQVKAEFNRTAGKFYGRVN